MQGCIIDQQEVVPKKSSEANAMAALSVGSLCACFVALAVTTTLEAHPLVEEVVSLDASAADGLVLPPKTAGRPEAVKSAKAYSYVLETVKGRPALARVLPQVMRCRTAPGPVLGFVAESGFVRGRMELSSDQEVVLGDSDGG